MSEQTGGFLNSRVCAKNYINVTFTWVSEWLLFNANSAVFQLYNGGNWLIFSEMMMRSAAADPGFQVRGAHLKKLRRAEGGAKIVGVFRVKNHDFTPKNLIFSNFRRQRPLDLRLVCCVLDQRAELDFNRANSLKQQSAGRPVAPLGHIILIPRQPVFPLSTYAVCLAETQQTYILYLWFDPIRSGTHDLPHSRQER